MDCRTDSKIGIDDLTAILDEFDTQIELDMQEIYQMGASTDEPFARHGTEPPEETEIETEVETVAETEGATIVNTDELSDVDIESVVLEDADVNEAADSDVEITNADALSYNDSDDNIVFDKYDTVVESDSINGSTNADDIDVMSAYSDANAESSDMDSSTDTDNSAETSSDSSPDDDIEDRNWLFEENVRLREVEKHLEEEKSRLEAYEKELEQKAKDIEEMNEKFIKDRAQFRDEMNLLTSQATRERQRLKQDEQFFDKKMEILKAGFADLDKAKRELEAEKMRYEAQSSYYGDDDIPGYGAPIARSLFVGITNPLMLKKRYKDLVKIYHPDNLAGDHDLFKAITIEYERLQGKIGSEGIG